MLASFPSLTFKLSFMLSHLLLATLAAGAAATPILRSGCGDVDPAWTPVDDKNVYTSVSYDGNYLCAIDTSANFVCTTPATTPLTWFTAYENVQSGVVGGNWAGVVSNNKFYFSTTFRPDAFYVQISLGAPAVAAWGDKDVKGYTTTRSSSYELIPSSARDLGGNMVKIAVGDKTFYGIDATGALSNMPVPKRGDEPTPWVPVTGAPTLSEVSVGNGRVCGVTKADKTIVCTTDNVNWTTLPGANWAHVSVFGGTAFATDGSNKLSSYTFN